jgi:hypothetical protein
VVGLDGFGDLKIGMMRCSKIAFESGSAASAVETPNNIKTACAGRVLKHVNVNRHQLMPQAYARRLRIGDTVLLLSMAIDNTQAALR